jgi:hypothetical protein
MDERGNLIEIVTYKKQNIAKLIGMTVDELMIG